MKNKGLQIGFMMVVLILALMPRSCFKEGEMPEMSLEPEAMEVFRLDGRAPAVDLERGFMLFHLGEESLPSFSPMVEFGDFEGILWNGVELEKGGIIDLGPLQYHKSYSIRAKKGKKELELQLYFTPLPVSHIRTEQKIRDEPKTLSIMELQGPGQCMSSFAGIELRGVTAMNHPKKAFGLELWQNSFGVDDPKALLGMRRDEDWFLDAMYIDRQRMRNKLAFEIWEDMLSPVSGDDFESVLPGIRLEYVELFINHSYQGLYCLGERMDESVLGLADGQEGAVLYKSVDWDHGAATFASYKTTPPVLLKWDGWEQLYPEKGPAWEALDQLRSLVVRGSRDEFAGDIASAVDLDNAADYYLLLNFLLAWDNRGKNIFYARNSGDAPLYMIPWDLEASLGRMYDQSNSLTVGILDNELFKRLLETDETGFSKLVREKWKLYRQGILQEEALEERIRGYCLLLENSGAIERENLRWDVEIDLQSECAYMMQWISQRLSYLDGIFAVE